MIPVDFTAAMLAAAGPPAGPSAGLAPETIAAAQPENAVLDDVAPAFGAPAPEALPAPVSVPPTAEDPLPVADPAAPPPDPAAPASTPASTPAPTNETDFEIDGLDKPNDPIEPINRLSFKLFWAIDAVAIRPAAMVYRNVVPKPLRDGARNAMTNLSEPLVLANDVLQLRPKRALKSLGRFLLNSVFGIAGLFDIAKRKPFNIAFHYNSFGSTLGYYGVKPGPYLYLPIGSPVGIGPTTLRDLVDYGQGFVWPEPVGYPFDQGEYDLATTIVGGVGDREANDAELKAMFSDSIDKYASFRSNFLQNRQGEIEVLKARDGEEPKGSEFADPLADPEAEAKVQDPAEPATANQPKTLPEGAPEPVTP